MTPKLKAIQLVNSFDELGRDFTRGVSMKEFSKQCALIAVDEILTINDERPYMLSGFKETFYKEVKKEIEKL